jgi:hypothetical protein
MEHRKLNVKQRMISLVGFRKFPSVDQKNAKT